MIIDMHTHYHNYELHGEGLRFSPEEFVHELDHHGIDKAVVSNAFYLESDFIFGNRLLFELMEKFPDKIIGFAIVHPLFPEESIKIAEEGVARGIKGFKIHCELSHVPYDDPMHLDLVEALSEHGLPFALHSGINYLDSAPTMARRFPDTTFLFGHAGGFAYRRMMERIKPLDNVIADLCGDVYLDDFVKDVVQAVGDERVVYSSDFTFMDPAIMLSLVETAEISDSSKEKILGGNAERILGL